MALEAFERDLVGGGDDIAEERRETVTAEIRRTQVLVGSLRIKGNITADILIDGEYRDRMPSKAPLRVAAGNHTLLVQSGHTIIHDENIKVVGQMETIVEIEAKGERGGADKSGEQTGLIDKESGLSDETVSKPQTSDNGADSASSGKSRLKTIGIVLVGTGAAVLVAGGITGGLALAKNNQLKSKCPVETNIARF